MLPEDNRTHDIAGGMPRRTQLPEVVRANILRQMEARGLVKADIAKRTGLSRSAMTGLIEANKVPELLTIQRIAECLGLEPYMLLMEQKPGETPKWQEQELLTLFRAVSDNDKAYVLGYLRGRMPP